MTTKLLRGLKLYEQLNRYQFKKDMPKDSGVVGFFAVNFGLWGVWYVTRGFHGLHLKNGEQMPFHEMHTLDGDRVIGQRDLTLADGTKYETAWRESMAAAIDKRCGLSC
jgi:hypothetical protein